MRGRCARREYAQPEAQADLAKGVHPDVVAARLGVSGTHVRELATTNKWPVRWEPPKADRIIDRFTNVYGLRA